MLTVNKNYNIDCQLGLKELKDNSVDLHLFSPPYDNLRDYKGKCILDFEYIGKHIARTLKEGGICAMIIQDQTKDGRKSLTSFKTIINWCENTELDLWECCIYERSGTPGAWWNKRFRVDHEFIAIFVKGKRPQYFNKTELMVPAVQAGLVKATGGSRKTNGETNKNIVKVINPMKCRGTIWNYTNDSKSRDKIKKQHPATFPDRLAADLIKCFTEKNMLVVDMFSGSGTTLCMAEKLERQWIGFELSKEYCDIAEKRIEEALNQASFLVAQ